MLQLVIFLASKPPGHSGRRIRYHCGEQRTYDFSDGTESCTNECSRPAKFDFRWKKKDTRALRNNPQNLKQEGARVSVSVIVYSKSDFMVRALDLEGIKNSRIIVAY